MSNKFLDSKGLEILWELIKQEVQNKQVTTVNSSQYWNDNADYIPKAGEIIVYSDYKIIEDGESIQTIPGIKVGDGTTKVEDLKFTSTSVAEKVQHSLYIGDQVYDGSEDVRILIYKGENK